MERFIFRSRVLFYEVTSWPNRMLHFDSRTITFSKQLTCVASWTNIPADSMLPDPSFSASCFIDLSGKGNVEELSACNWKKGQCLRKLLFPVMYEIFNFLKKRKVQNTWDVNEAKRFCGLLQEEDMSFYRYERRL